MAWYDGAWDVLGGLAKGGLEYLAAKEAADAQVQIAKASAGTGSEVLLPLLAMMMGGGMGAAQPQLAPVAPGVPTPLLGGLVNRRTGTFGAGMLPTTAPLIPAFTQQPGAATGPIPALGGTMANPPYAQTGLLSDLAPFATTPLLNYLLPPANGGAAGGALINAPEVFRAQPAGHRARSFFGAVNPTTGNISWFRNAGRPILWSADLRACKRVRRVAGMARRASPRRRSTSRRR